MTPEKAAYHRLMLLVGFREQYDQELDAALEAEDPISELVLELTFCLSDLNKTVSALHNYTLANAPDWQQVFDMVMQELRKRYATQSLTAAELAKMMYTIAENCEKGDETPWFELHFPAYDYELVEIGLASEEEFQRAFDSWFLHGERLIAPTQTEKKCSIRSLMRKAFRKEKSL